MTWLHNSKAGKAPLVLHTGKEGESTVIMMCAFPIHPRLILLISKVLYHVTLTKSFLLRFDRFPNSRQVSKKIPANRKRHKIGTNRGHHEAVENKERNTTSTINIHQPVPRPQPGSTTSAKVTLPGILIVTWMVHGQTLVIPFQSLSALATGKP